MLGGLDRPTAGRIFMNGQDISRLSERQQAFLRCHQIGYIFQTFNLIPAMSAIENVSLPLIFSGIPMDRAGAKAAEALASVGLGDRLHHHPFELSGGQQQRVAVARALANDPKLILADEPTGNLDTKTGAEIIELLKTLQREKHVTTVTATHDVKMLQISDRIVWIRDGLVERVEEKDQVKITVS
jgi:putative ABC transport system ATP-binding protein